MLTDFEHYVDDRGELSLNAKQLREDDPKRYAQIFLDSLAYYSGWPKHLVREGPGHIDPGMHSTSRKSHIRSILFMSDRSDNSGDVLVVDQRAGSPHRAHTTSTMLCTTCHLATPRASTFESPEVNAQTMTSCG